MYSRLSEVEWLTEKLTDLYRPWYDDGLPPELAFGEIEAWGYVRKSMIRQAQMAFEMEIPFGVFQIIGIEYARRAAKSRWPRERLLMEDVSCAYRPIDLRVNEHSPVPQILIDRLVFLLARYLAHVDSPWSDEQIREAIERFIREFPHVVSDGMKPEAK